MKRTAITLLLLASVTGCHKGTVRHDTVAPTSCSIEEHSSSMATTTSGDLVYVYPRAVDYSDGVLGVVGYPNYIWVHDSLGNDPGIIADSVIGMLVPEQGPVQLMPAPTRSIRIRHPRIAAISRNRWAVVFSEYPLDLKEEISSSEATGIWHGVFDATSGTWESINPIPDSVASTFLTANSSALIQAADTLFWAAGRTRKDRVEDIVVYVHDAGGWRAEKLVEERPAYLQADYSSPERGLYVTAVHIDRTISGNGSLWLYSRTPSWTSRKLVQPRNGFIDFPSPSIDSLGNGFVTWSMDVADSARSRKEVHMLQLSGNERFAPRRVVPHAVTAVTLGTAGLLFTVDAPRWGVAAGQIEIRSLNAPEQILGSLDNPYMVPFGTAIDSAGGLILVGAARDSLNTISSKIIRARSKCGPQ